MARLGACKSASRRRDQDRPHKSEMAATAASTICRCHTEASIYHNTAHWGSGRSSGPVSANSSFSKGPHSKYPPYFFQKAYLVTNPDKNPDCAAPAPGDHSSVRPFFFSSWIASLVLRLHGRRPPMFSPLFSYPGPEHSPQVLLVGRGRAKTGQKGLC